MCEKKKEVCVCVYVYVCLCECQREGGREEGREGVRKGARGAFIKREPTEEWWEKKESIKKLLLLSY